MESIVEPRFYLDVGFGESQCDIVHEYSVGAMSGQAFMFRQPLFNEDLPQEGYEYE
jgi:hypothetical protein